MTHSYEAETLERIGRHLAWLRPRVRSGEATTRQDGTEIDPPTVAKRRGVLVVADRCLPEGLDRANYQEIDSHLARWSGWSRYTYDTHMRGYYTWAVWAGEIDFNPMDDIPKPPGGPKIPHPCTDEQLAVAATARQPYGLAIVLAGYLGLRAGEIARASSADIIGDRLLVLGKGGKERMVPIAPEVADVVYRSRGRLLGRNLSEQTLTNHQRPAWREVGLPEEFRLHSARHWYATELLRSGADIREVQTLLGHSSLATTEVYLAVAGARLTAAVARLPHLGIKVGAGTSRCLPGSSPSPASRAA